jgi:hypothetical protein
MQPYHFLKIVKQVKIKYMEKVIDFIGARMTTLNRGIVATPESREFLESFAKANHGSMDLLLMQMAIQYGYKIALEDIAEVVVLQSEYDSE